MRKKDLVGNIFGRLTVVSELPERTKRGMIRWLCKCECGNERIVSVGNLISGYVNSCGCFRKEFAKNKFTTHGKKDTPEYGVWCGMKGRCYNPNNKKYKIYGAVGVKVCDRWLVSFKNFLADMGERPTNDHTIDRFPNKYGNYEPTNCRWATQLQQQGNRRDNVWIEYLGERMIIADWSRRLWINGRILSKEIKIKSMAEIIEYYKR